MKLFFLFLSPLLLFALEIKQTPILFGAKRVALTQEYIRLHYDTESKSIKIKPKIIVLHYTANSDFNTSLSFFHKEELQSSDRPDIKKASTLNVSAHFLVQRDGTVHQLIPLDTMARHVIGLNHTAIGIENVGTEDNLTPQQLAANIALINYLKEKIPSLTYLIGHYEYQCFEKTALWLEKQSHYRTQKHDPSPAFMAKVRAKISGLKGAPCE